MILAIAFSAFALFTIGTLITLLSGRSAFFTGTRQMVFGLLGAAVTYGLGQLIGHVIGA